MVHDLV